MAINNSTTGFESYDTKTVLQNMTSTDSVVARAIGDLSFGKSVSQWFSGLNSDNNFVGISKDGIKTLSDNLKSYVDELQGIIDGYNENAKLNLALAEGSKAATAASNFIKDIKVLLQAYISTIKVYADTAEKAYENWGKSDTSIGSDVDTSGSDIRQAAENLELD